MAEFSPPRCNSFIECNLGVLARGCVNGRVRDRVHGSHAWVRVGERVWARGRVHVRTFAPLRSSSFVSFTQCSSICVKVVVELQIWNLAGLATCTLLL